MGSRSWPQVQVNYPHSIQQRSHPSLQAVVVQVGSASVFVLEGEAVVIFLLGGLLCLREEVRVAELWGREAWA